MALATVANLKLLLGITGSGQDSLLTLVLNAAESSVRTWLQRGKARGAFVSWPESGSDTMYLDGSGTAELVLPFRPVTTLTSVYLDVGGQYGTATGAFAATTLLTEGTDFVLKRDDGASVSASGILVRLGTSSVGTLGGLGLHAEFGAIGPMPTLTAGRSVAWPRVRGCIKATWTAGFTSVPNDLSMAVLQVAAFIKRTGPFGGQNPVLSESLRDYSYSVGTTALGSSPDLGSVRQILSRYRTIVVA